MHNVKMTLPKPPNLTPEEEASLQKELEARIEVLCKDGKVLDWKGHFKHGEMFSRGWDPQGYLKRMLLDSLMFGMWRHTLGLRAFVRRLDDGPVLDEPLLLSSCSDLSCQVCGARLKIGFNGKGLVVIGEPCPYPEGLVTEWELNVPSGKLVIANDLREWFPSDEDYDVNSVVNQHLTTLAYAKVGMAHGFVSNTCPDVYREGDRFVIGNYRETLWNEGDDKEHANPEPCPWGKSVASVCTDLWWYSIVDRDELARRVPHYTPGTKLKTVLKHAKVVSVRPGVYKFRQEQGVDSDQELVEFARFEWVREPDDVIDYLKDQREKNFTAIEVLIEQCLAWPSLYMEVSPLDPREREHSYAVARWEGFTLEEKKHALARAADQIMCVLGGGVEWHENGFPRRVISEDARRFAAEMGEVPAFDFQMRWYPISAGYGGLCNGAGITAEHLGKEIRLAPTFVLLGLNICQNAIKFGETPDRGRVAEARKRMRLFMDCYLGLRKRHPDIVFDTEFDLWMRETDLDGYVADFDFSSSDG